MVTSEQMARLTRIQEQAKQENVRLTQHAHEEMVDEAITVEELLVAILSGEAQVVEDYPEHRRGACCLLCGFTGSRRPLHVVCTTEQPALIIITVYEPKPPRWVTPTQRGAR